jgi:hypothetical protein
MENSSSNNPSEQEKLDHIEIAADNDPLKWAKSPITKVAWLDAVSENPKYKDIDINRIIRGYVIEGITQDDETVFVECNENCKEKLLIRMKWEVELPEKHLPVEISALIKETLNEIENKNIKESEPAWMEMENKINQMVKNTYQTDVIDYYRFNRKILEKDYNSWLHQKSKK